MKEYKGSVVESLGIGEERGDALAKICEDLAVKMDTAEINSPSDLLKIIQVLPETTEIERLFIAFRFGYVAAV